MKKIIANGIALQSLLPNIPTLFILMKNGKPFYTHYKNNVEYAVNECGYEYVGFIVNSIFKECESK